MHIADGPVIDAGNGVTVTTAVVVYTSTEYVITAVPAETPVTTPVVRLIPATPGAPDIHVPPGLASVSAVVLPWQTVFMPPMGAICAKTILLKNITAKNSNSLFIKILSGKYKNSIQIY
jgi:hypothetical protein